MKTPTQSQQRYFGFAISSALLMISWITWRAFSSAVLSGSIVGGAAGMAGVYYFIPSTQPWLIRTFRAITFPIQWIMTLLVLAIVYYMVLTPIALWYRARGKSIRVTSSDAVTNWQPHESASSPDSYFKTF
ncbi:MAG: hypothetical protein KDB00_07525 [Planctomycetales bacterium]|nr:hypothetical protein [Planctomycetales bacterium]